MYTSMWTYAWDLDDCGMDVALGELRDHGVGDVSVATAYHCGRFLQIRSPRRKIYFPQDGVLYYPAPAEDFADSRIKPLVGDFARERPDFFPELSRRAEALGMTVSGWTVCLHNTRLGYLYPEACVQNAFGDTVYFSQCPANDDVRAYMAALLRSEDRRLSLHTLQMESMNYMGFAHEYHHEKDGVGLTALEDFLLSLCFCPACMRKGRAAGINMEHVRNRVRDDVVRYLSLPRAEVPSDRFLREGPDFFADDADVRAFLNWRAGVVTSLVERVAGEVSRAQLCFLSLLANASSWLFGVDLKAVSRFLGSALVCSYDCGADRARADVAASRAELDPACKVYTGMRAFTPEYTGREAFVDKVRAALAAGTQGFVFYNYGLIPQGRMRWIGEACEAIRETEEKR